MYNYNVNWESLVKANTPYHKRKFYRLKWLNFLIVEIKKLHQIFLTWSTETTYAAAHNGMKISMEKVLNDQFDPINQLIYIGLAVDEDQMFLFTKPELQQNYIYTKYNAATAYTVGQFANYGIYTWVCIQNTTGNTPADPSIYWQIHKPRLYLYQSDEYVSLGFIVWVPVGLVYDVDQMNAWINKYKLAGITHTIQTYTP